ncbi:MAG TPA: AMP-binding protein [Candidatus Acidoferrales bacterium]|nr:AMP-binding protein [Candidatus Acidoferrales bacterium]
MGESAILGAVRTAAARRPDAPAVVSPRETLAYATLERRAAAVAAQLAGVTGNIVGLLHPNSPGFVAGLLGARWAGKTVAVLPWIAPAPLLKLMAAEAGFRSVLAAEELAPRAMEAGLEPIVAPPPGDSTRAASDPPLAPRALEAAVLLYTSGTTGRPKAVALSETNLLANIEGCRVAGEFTADDVMLAILPLFHAFGLTVTLLLPLTLGGKVVLEDRFVPRTSLQSVAEHRVTAMIGVPSQFRLLAKEPENVDAASLRLCIAGAERLGDHVGEAFERRFSRPLLQGYGATEASPVVAFNRPQHNRPGSVGLPLYNVRVTVREDMRELPGGEHGELCVEGPSVMLGYSGQPEATAQKIPGGVLRTGDRGWLDADGFLHLAGRADDMLKVAGEKVYPAEIERVLEQMDGVEEAAVIGVADQARGTTLAAFVVARPGTTLDPAALRAACRERLEAAKTPRTIAVVEQFPRGLSGKVDKKALLDQAVRTDSGAN